MVERRTRDRLGPAGREPAGSLVVYEVSLRYTEQDLQPRVERGTEIAYRITDLHGQGQPARYFVLSAAPVPRRGDKPGDRTDWYLVMNEATDFGDLDQVVAS